MTSFSNRKTVKELVEEIGLQIIYENSDYLAELVPHSVVKNFNEIKASNTAERETVINDFLRERGHPPLKKRRLSHDEQREIKKVEKYENWSYRKFEMPEDRTQIFGEMENWIEGFRQYYRGENIDEEVAMKALQYKSGDFVEREIKQIHSMNPKAIYDLKLTHQYLIKNCNTMTRWLLLIKELKNLSGKDKDFAKLKAVHDGCNLKIENQKIVEGLRKIFFETGDCVYRKIESKTNISAKVSQRKYLFHIR